MRGFQILLIVGMMVGAIFSSPVKFPDEEQPAEITDEDCSSTTEGLPNLQPERTLGMKKDSMTNVQKGRGFIGSKVSLPSTNNRKAPMPPSPNRNKVPMFASPNKKPSIPLPPNKKAVPMNLPQTYRKAPINPLSISNKKGAGLNKGESERGVSAQRALIGVTAPAENNTRGTGVAPTEGARSPSTLSNTNKTSGGTSGIRTGMGAFPSTFLRTPLTRPGSVGTGVNPMAPAGAPTTTGSGPSTGAKPMTPTKESGGVAPTGVYPVSPARPPAAGVVPKPPIKQSEKGAGVTVKPVKSAVIEKVPASRKEVQETVLAVAPTPTGGPVKEETAQKVLPEKVGTAVAVEYPGMLREGPEKGATVPEAPISEGPEKGATVPEAPISEGSENRVPPPPPDQALSTGASESLLVVTPEPSFRNEVSPPTSTLNSESNPPNRTLLVAETIPANNTPEIKGEINDVPAAVTPVVTGEEINKYIDIKDECDPSRESAMAYATSNKGKVLANALAKKCGGALANATKGSQADATAQTFGSGDARANSETEGAGGAVSTANAQGSGKAIGISSSGGVGDSSSTALSNTNDAFAKSNSLGGGKADSLALSTAGGSAKALSKTLKGGSARSDAGSAGGGDAKATAVADEGGSAKAKSFANRQGSAKSISKTTNGDGEAEADAMAQDSGKAVADAASDIGDSNAGTVSGIGDALDAESQVKR